MCIRDRPDRIVRWLKTWEAQSQRENKSYDSIADAAQRLQKNDPLLDDRVAAKLAQHLTQSKDGAFVFKHDPLHMTRAPYPFLLDTADEFWQRIEAPTLLLEGNKSRFKKDATDTKRRKSCFPQQTSIVIEGAGHWMQLHKPQAVASAILNHIN